MGALGINVDALLDTDILIGILRDDPQTVAWLRSIDDHRFGISAVVWMEVVRGATNKVNLQQLVKLLEQYRVFPITEADTFWAMEQLANFRLSHGIDYADCLIAAAAARTGLPLYTRNHKHYAPLLGTNALRPY
ncbi:MAG: PIN domain-containing protein [Anaerolineae bacterium]|nr:PIN domain-containing protein [Anaerolineae bacterium]